MSANSCLRAGTIIYSMIAVTSLQLAPSIPVHVDCCGVESGVINLYGDDLSPIRGQSESMRRLDRLSELRAGWDGYDAQPVSAVAIANAREILYRLSRQPEIFPTGRGTVQMEYELDNLDYLEYEIGDEVVTRFLSRSDGTAQTCTYPVQRALPDMIAKEVEAFHGCVGNSGMGEALSGGTLQYA